ncbi:Post-GPI attachment to proteins factor 2 [Trichoplax sp. H2]|nr:Post-GPI attachment to proteins factor 2 [Trichoplax sp. H2]|eukprot:RDD39219.1 Post-GPI attachment to proteins factor 2 [Trichoplax sp. H2]
MASSELAAKPTFFTHKFRRSGYVVLSLPLLSFSVCLILTFLYHFEESLATHCKVMVANLAVDNGLLAASFNITTVEDINPASYAGADLADDNYYINGVPQFLPSLSAAICNSPQSYIWRLGIGFHSGPRIYYNVLYYDVFQTYRPTDPSNWPTLYWLISVVTVISGILENFFLMLLSNVPSTENHRKNSTINSNYYTFTVSTINSL